MVAGDKDLAMRTLFVATLLPLLALTAAGPAQTGSAAPTQGRPPVPAPVRIILVGASTVTPHTGWGGMFCARHVVEMVACLNLAHGGRSTHTYRAEGFWDLALREFAVAGYEATYVLIEMGHNDKSTNPDVGVDLRTEFPDNLRRFVIEARAAGATPVLVTPLATRHFRDGKLFDTLSPWAEEVRSVASEMAVPLVELNRASEEVYQGMGAEGAMAFSAVPPSEVERRAAQAGTTLHPRVPSAVPVSDLLPADDPRRSYTQDYTHLNAQGADVMSKAVATHLAPAVPELRGLIVP